MADTLTKLTYKTFQESKNLFSLAHKNLSTRFLETISPSSEPKKSIPISPQVLLRVKEKLNELLEVDWQDAEDGIYPHNLLFDNPWDDFFRYYPIVCLDLLSTWERAKQKQYQDFSSSVDTKYYPRYYLQNFHYQTDGYLSDLSANLYDIQVEVLFGGCADAMRRRILSPLKKGLNLFHNESQNMKLNVLDVACGTGRTLKLIRNSNPEISLFGTDLSPAYLRKANELLSEIPGELPQLLQANAEYLPYLDNYFHGVTSVFLFHELPAPVRQKVISECFRITKPGGVFILCDSIQMSDAPDMEGIMQNFQERFHEPYYQNYINDDLIERLQTVGFENIEVQIHFMSKYLIAHKP
ncbi:MAG: class I SAM-dependent methyltransferase [Cyanobacteria bacterium P01_A01_bin.84]